MFIRVWEFDVRRDRTETFLTAYGPRGAWVEIFSQGSGYLGTDLYRHTEVAHRFITVDRWLDIGSWRSFLDLFGTAYDALDAQLGDLTQAERLVLEGSP